MRDARAIIARASFVGPQAARGFAMETWGSRKRTASRYTSRFLTCVA
jgi:hypothetical protein